MQPVTPSSGVWMSRLRSSVATSCSMYSGWPFATTRTARLSVKKNGHLLGYHGVGRVQNEYGNFAAPECNGQVELLQRANKRVVLVALDDDANAGTRVQVLTWIDLEQGDQFLGGIVPSTQLIRPCSMHFSDAVKSLNQASAFELFRMRAAIDRVLDQPQWLQAVQSRLRVGQEVSYFDPQANTQRRGRILEMRRKQVVVLELDAIQRWLISYAAINLDGVDVQIREHKQQGLGRNEVAIGEVVGFVDRNQQNRTGQIIRLNDKTVSLQCGNTQWRVAYQFLHRVLDAAGSTHDGIEIGAAVNPVKD